MVAIFQMVHDNTEYLTIREVVIKVSERTVRRGMTGYGLVSFYVFIAADNERDAQDSVEIILARPQVKSCVIERSWYDGDDYMKCHVYQCRVEVKRDERPNSIASLMRWIEMQLT